MSVLMVETHGGFLPPSPMDEWTVDDLARLPDDGRRYEIIDGSLVVSPSPTFRHQNVGTWLTVLLHGGKPPDVEVVQAVDVVLPAPQTRVLVPDVVAVRIGPEFDGIAPRVPAGAVLLAVEIVSPSSTSMDRMLKPHLYAEAGIGCYWRVEGGPDGPTVHTHVLAGGGYRQVHEISPGERMTLDVPWRLTIAPPLTGGVTG